MMQPEQPEVQTALLLSPPRHHTAVYQRWVITDQTESKCKFNGEIHAKAKLFENGPDAQRQGQRRDGHTGNSGRTRMVGTLQGVHIFHSAVHRPHQPDAPPNSAAGLHPLRDVAGGDRGGIDQRDMPRYHLHVLWCRLMVSHGTCGATPLKLLPKAVR